MAHVGYARKYRKQYVRHVVRRRHRNGAEAILSPKTRDASTPRVHMMMGSPPSVMIGHPDAPCSQEVTAPYSPGSPVRRRMPYLDGEVCTLDWTPTWWYQIVTLVLWLIICTYVYQHAVMVAGAHRASLQTVQQGNLAVGSVDPLVQGFHSVTRWTHDTYQQFHDSVQTWALDFTKDFESRFHNGTMQRCRHRDGRGLCFPQTQIPTCGMTTGGGDSLDSWNTWNTSKTWNTDRSENTTTARRIAENPLVPVSSGTVYSTTTDNMVQPQHLPHPRLRARLCTSLDATTTNAGATLVSSSPHESFLEWLTPAHVILATLVVREMVHEQVLLVSTILAQWVALSTTWVAMAWTNHVPW
jgi:hypothetical protein